MTDKDILNMLYKITPNGYNQHKKLSKCIEIWSDDHIDFTDEYVSTLREVEVLDRPCAEVYKEYTDWCKLNYIPEILHINTFSKYINYYLQVKSKSVKGKRYYCK